jgi:hypothetical protein
MWELCKRAYPILCIEMEPVTTVWCYDLERYKDECDRISNDLSILQVFELQYNDTGGRLAMDMRELWDEWLGLRGVLAKYLGKDTEIKALDSEYLRSGDRLLRTIQPLPELTFSPRHVEGSHSGSSDNQLNLDDVISYGSEETKHSLYV